MIKSPKNFKTQISTFYNAHAVLNINNKNILFNI